MAGQSTNWYRETDLPLCTADIIVSQVIEHGVEVQRKIMAGTRVPADLIDAYEKATKPKAAAKPPAGKATA